MSNGINQMRTRMRRPPVCKSKAPEDKRPMPATVDVDLTWVIIDGMDSSTVTNKLVTCTRLSGTNVYIGAALDDEGNSFSCTFTLGRLPSISTVLVSITSAPLGNPELTGEQDGWPGTSPFTSTMQPLYRFIVDHVGDSIYNCTLA